MSSVNGIRKRETKTRAITPKVIAIIAVFAMCTLVLPASFASNVASSTAGTPESAVASVQVSLDLGHGYIEYDGQTVAAPSTAITAPEGRDLVFSASADSGYTLDAVNMIVNGSSSTLTRLADSTYIIGADALENGVSIQLVTSQDIIDPAAESTVISDASNAPSGQQDAVQNARTVYTYEDDAVIVTATLDDASALPAGAVFVVAPVTKDSKDGNGNAVYDYDAYMEALNASVQDTSSQTYTSENTLLYDVAFMVDGVEHEPAQGSVKIDIQFKHNQLSAGLSADEQNLNQVEIKHLPLNSAVRDSVDSTAKATDISASDIAVEPVSDQSVSLEGEQSISFKLESLSVIAATNPSSASGTVASGASVSPASEQDAVSHDIADYLDKYYDTSRYGTSTVTIGGVALENLTEVKFNDEVSVSLVWGFPNSLHVKAGDVFTYQLPQGVNWAYDDEAKSGTVFNESGVGIGSYSADENGLVTITYTSDLASNLVGSLNITGYINQLVKDSGGNFILSLEFGGKDWNLPVVSGTTNIEIEKVGGNYVPDASDLSLRQFTLRVLSLGSNSDVTINDTPTTVTINGQKKAALEFVPDSLLVYSDPECTQLVQDSGVSVVNVNSEDGSFEFHIDKMNDLETYYIVYQMRITNDGYNAHLGTSWNSSSEYVGGYGADMTKLSNSVQYKMEQISTAEIPLYQTSHAVAKSCGAYNYDTGTVDWTIQVVTGDTELHLKDAPDSRLGRFENIAVYEQVGGNWVEVNDQDILGSITYENLLAGTATLPAAVEAGATRSFKITYTTTAPRLDIGDVTYNNQIIGNERTWSGSWYGGGVGSGVSVNGAGKATIQKLAQPSTAYISYDSDGNPSYAGSTIHWETHVNTPVRTVAYTNFTLKDNVGWGDGMTILQDSLHVFTDAEHANEIDQDNYSVSWGNSRSNVTSFTLVFKDEYAYKGGDLYITCDTKGHSAYGSGDINFATQNNNPSSSYTNIMKVSADEFAEVSSTGTYTYYRHRIQKRAEPDQASDNAWRGAGWSNTNSLSGRITWTLSLYGLGNGELDTNPDVTLTDTHPSRLTFDPDSCRYVVGGVDQWHSVVKQGDYLNDIVPTQNEDGSVTFTVTTGGDAYEVLRAGKGIVILYDTTYNPYESVDGVITDTTADGVKDTVSNSVSLSFGSIGDTVSSSFSFPHQELLTKSCIYTEDTAPNATFTIEVNKWSADLAPNSESLKLTDRSGNALALRPETLRVAVYDSQGKAPKDSSGDIVYTPILDLESEGFSYSIDGDGQLTLIAPDETHFSLAYETLVQLKPGASIEEEEAANSVNLEGYGGPSTSSIGTKVLASNATTKSAGNAVKIHKADAAKTSLALAGASYEIQKVDVSESAGTSGKTMWTAGSASSVETLTTDETGWSSISDSLGSDQIYRLHETSAPEGYSLADDIYFVFRGDQGAESIDYSNVELVDEQGRSLSYEVYDSDISVKAIFLVDSSAPAILTVNKSVDGAAPAAGQSFTFRLKEFTDSTFATLDRSATDRVAVNEGGVAEFSFEDLATGTHYFKLSEDIADEYAVNNTFYYVKVDVSESRGGRVVDVNAYSDKEMTSVVENATVSYENATHPGEVPPPENPRDDEPSVSKTATNLDENYESQVTLSIPAADDQATYDIVFVADVSMSESVEAAKLMSRYVEAAEAANSDIRVGIVYFYKCAKIGRSLDGDTGYVLGSAKESGTNLAAGIALGKKMLDDDTVVTDPNNKYLVVLSDGDTHVYQKDNQLNFTGETTGANVSKGKTTGETVVTQTYGGGTPFAGPASYAYKYFGNGNEPDSFAAPEDWDAYFELVAQEIALDGNDYEIAWNYVNNRYSYATNPIPEDEISHHAVSSDKALYYSLVNYEAAQEAGYHCYATYVYGGTYSRTELYGKSFMAYLNGGQSIDLENLDGELSVVEPGAYVKDIMGSGIDNLGNPYNMDFVNDIAKTDLVLNGETLAKRVNGDGSFSFGAEQGGSFEEWFRLTYTKTRTDSGTEAENDSFVWDILTPIHAYDSVQLVYSVKLYDPQTATGTYGVFDADGSGNGESLLTNTSATLYPPDEPPIEFPKPTVDYTVKNVNFGTSYSKYYFGEGQPTFTFTMTAADENWNTRAGSQAAYGANDSVVEDGSAFYIQVANGAYDENGYAPITFPEISYSEPGTYHYVVTEDKIDGYATDPVEYLVSVEISDALEASASVEMLYDGSVYEIDLADAAFFNNETVSLSSAGLSAMSFGAGSGSISAEMPLAGEAIDVELYKVSREGGEGLFDCTYALYMSNPFGEDIVIAEATTDETGYMVFKDVVLDPDELYYFKEVQAPSGHKVDPYRSAYFRAVYDYATGETALVLAEETSDGLHAAGE